MPSLSAGLSLPAPGKPQGMPSYFSSKMSPVYRHGQAFFYTELDNYNFRLEDDHLRISPHTIQAAGPTRTLDVSQLTSIVFIQTQDEASLTICDKAGSSAVSTSTHQAYQLINLLASLDNSLLDLPPSGDS